VRPSARKGEGRPSAREKESGLRRAGESAAFGTQQRVVYSVQERSRPSAHDEEYGQRPARKKEERGHRHAKEERGRRHAKNCAAVGTRGLVRPSARHELRGIPHAMNCAAIGTQGLTRPLAREDRRSRWHARMRWGCSTRGRSVRHRPALR
jgi:hypothetical protein